MPSPIFIEPTSCAVNEILLAECSVSVDSTILVYTAELLGIATVKSVVPFTATTFITLPFTQPVPPDKYAWFTDVFTAYDFAVGSQVIVMLLPLTVNAFDVSMSPLLLTNKLPNVGLEYEISAGVYLTSVEGVICLPNSKPI